MEKQDVPNKENKGRWENKEYVKELKVFQFTQYIVRYCEDIWNKTAKLS